MATSSYTFNQQKLDLLNQELAKVCIDPIEINANGQDVVTQQPTDATAEDPMDANGQDVVTQQPTDATAEDPMDANGQDVVTQQPTAPVGEPSPVAEPTAPSLSPEAQAITDKGASAIHVDNDTDGLNTTSIDNGIQFDIFGNGTPTNVGWGTSDDGLLAIDNNGNGTIDDGTELFGGGVGQGFGKLATFDSNADGTVDSNDTNFSSLQVWNDGNSDAVTDPGELRPLMDVGIASLDLGFTNDFETINNGNLYGETSTGMNADGSEFSITQVYYPIA